MTVPSANGLPTRKMIMGFSSVFSHVFNLLSYLSEKSGGTVRMGMTENKPYCFWFYMGALDIPFIEAVVVPYLQKWDKDRRGKFGGETFPITFGRSDDNEIVLSIACNVTECELYDVMSHRSKTNCLKKGLQYREKVIPEIWWEGLHVGTKSCEV